jgi:hypothetical protein
MSPTTPSDAISTSEIKAILDQCLDEYWSDRFQDLIIDHPARMHAALQPFIRYQAERCPVNNASD